MPLPSVPGDTSEVVDAGVSPGIVQVNLPHPSGVTALDVLAEYPTFSKLVASISPDSATALKEEFGIGSNDLIVGMPADAAQALNLQHGDTVRVTIDGTTIILGDRQIRVATGTQKGPLTKCMLSKGIRTVTGLKDHRETGTGTAETIPFTVVIIGGEKAIWLKTDQKRA